MSCSKKIDENCLSLAKSQGEIFETSASLGIPSYRFIHSFMRSGYASSLDSFPFIDPSFSKEGALAEMKEKNKGATGTVYGKGELHWIGYIYRVISYLYGISSEKAFKEIPPSYLRSVYLPYHSLDPLKAVQIIFSDRGISPLSKEDRMRDIMNMR